MSKWELIIGGGYFKGNPTRGIVIQLFDPLEDYPTGWSTFYIIVINIYKFEFWIGFEKVANK